MKQSYILLRLLPIAIKILTIFLLIIALEFFQQFHDILFGFSWRFFFLLLRIALFFNTQTRFIFFCHERLKLPELLFHWSVIFALINNFHSTLFRKFSGLFQRFPFALRNYFRRLGLWFFHGSNLIYIDGWLRFND
jgi:hypothetical protein